ncbi:SDR family NAD(P)-dependent oxidoreductase [Mycolicibacterium sp. P1-18]|uniref:SDR family NAD(P)-dependent oxidoreductase n=1 Tax=Mycolicibacterium sp. P1-18 TaxID=2024615 RepID=UPI0011F2118C|nr:SDR family NAD(P)-dependent oxidoreductase [Mycolicibacterium sp. P1-18]KAA0101162.1 SDR family NAD(P)-dependent oxidoreductase [Mycolicibacterium sp. P1-18]
MADPENPTALIVGASKGLGLAMVSEFLSRDWHVIATVRGENRTALDELDARGRLEIDVLDVTMPDQISALRDRLASRRLDLLFVNAGVAHDDIPAAEVSTDSFVEVMVTNALSPLRVVEALEDLVPESGTIGVMSSRQGSVSLNTRGGHEVYRASKSALNQLFRSYAARHADDPRTLLLINPGHVQTELGGKGATLTVDDSVPGVVDTIVAHSGEGGLQFLDYQNAVVPW